MLSFIVCVTEGKQQTRSQAALVSEVITFYNVYTALTLHGKVR